MSVTPGRVERGAPRPGEATAEGLRAAARGRRDAAPAPTSTPALPLAGVRVLEMGSFTAAPVGTRLLAALGADVVKIEPRAGEGARHLAQQIGGEGYLYQVNNTDKRGVTLEIAAAGGRDVFFALARASDVFVENFAPGTAERWGLGPRAVLEVNERLVYCSVSGFGHAGPLGRKRAFDTVIQAMAGVMALTGAASEPPVKVGLSVADLLGGYLSTVAVLAALRYRDRTGRGQHVDVSMHDATGWLTARAWPDVLAGGGEPSRHGNRDPRAVPSGAYAARDGATVAIEARDDAEWRRLCAAMKRDDMAADPDLATAAGRWARHDALDAVIAAWVGERPSAEAVDACQAAGVAAGPVLSVPAVAEHPHTAARAMVVERAHRTLGSLRLLGIPLKLTRPEPEIRRTAPALGEHNTEVYASLAGIGPERLATLRAAGVL
jgi:crotonobetainyl-CoA:carnitine CoA-transferase CaiB-like acyl-CoA transferase